MNERFDRIESKNIRINIGYIFGILLFIGIASFIIYNNHGVKEIFYVGIALYVISFVLIIKSIQLYRNKDIKLIVDSRGITLTKYNKTYSWNLIKKTHIDYLRNKRGKQVSKQKYLFIKLETETIKIKIQNLNLNEKTFLKSAEYYLGETIAQIEKKEENQKIEEFIKKVPGMENKEQYDKGLEKYKQVQKSCFFIVVGFIILLIIIGIVAYNYFSNK